MLVEDFHIERGGLARSKGIHLAAQRIDLAGDVALPTGFVVPLKNMCSMK